MKDWIRSPSPDGYLPGAGASSDNTAASNTEGGSKQDKSDWQLDVVPGSGPAGSDAAVKTTVAPAFGIRRGVVGLSLPPGTRSSFVRAAGSNSTSSYAPPHQDINPVDSVSSSSASRSIPSLKSLCLSIVFRNLHQVRDLGYMSFSMAKPILEQCQAEQLAEILEHSPHLAPDAETLWKRLCFNDFVQIRKDAEAGRLQEPKSWRTLYRDTVDAAESHKAAVASRIKSRYASAQAAKEDRKIVVSERPIIRLSKTRWTSGMYGVSNGGLGGNGRAGANSQGQGMLARAADKGREKRRSSIGMIPPGATSSSILAGTKRKAGNIIFSSPPSSSHGTSGLPPASDQSPTLKRVGNRTTIGPNTNSNGSSSPYPVRIVKMVSATSSASKVPPGGLDFFGTCNTAGARGTPARNGSKVAQNSQHKLTSMNARLGSASTAKVKTKLTAATRTNGSASDAPAMVAGEDVPASKKQKRSAPRAVKEAGDGSDSCQKRVAVRGAVD